MANKLNFLFTHLDHESIKKPYTYELFQVLYTTYETVYSTTTVGGGTPPSHTLPPSLAPLAWARSLRSLAYYRPPYRLNPGYATGASSYMTNLSSSLTSKWAKKKGGEGVCTKLINMSMVCTPPPPCVRAWAITVDIYKPTPCCSSARPPPPPPPVHSPVPPAARPQPHISGCTCVRMVRTRERIRASYWIFATGVDDVATRDSRNPIDLLAVTQLKM